MSVFYSGDPHADFDRWDTEQASYESKLPRCGECDEPIHTDYCYLINDVPICPDCLENSYRKCTEDLIE